MKMRFGLGVLAYVAPTFALGFVWHLMLFHGYYVRLAIYRKDIINSLRVSCHLHLGFSICLHLPVRLRAAQWQPTVARAQLRGIRRRALVEFYDARRRGQERNDIGLRLFGD